MGSCDAIEADEAGVDADVDTEAEADADVDIEADADDAGWYRDDAMTNDREGCAFAIQAHHGELSNPHTTYKLSFTLFSQTRDKY